MGQILLAESIERSTRYLQKIKRWLECELGRYAMYQVVVTADDMIEGIS